MKAGEVERLSQQLHMLSVEYILAVLHRVTEESDSIHINLPGPISPFEMRISNGEIGHFMLTSKGQFSGGQSRKREALPMMRYHENEKARASSKQARKRTFSSIKYCATSS
jgi:hypothetical protein